MSYKIEFANNVGYRINNRAVKVNIIEYLAKTIDSYKLESNFIKNEDDLINIKNNKSLILPNIVGDDYIFIAKKIKEIFFLVFLEKKTLGNLNDINYNELNIINSKIRVKKNVYDGTIFDGRIVNLGGCTSFIINKIHYLYGEDMEKYSLNECHKFAESFIEESYIIDSNMNSIFFKLNKIFKLENIDDLINKNIANSKYNFSSIDFISKNSSKTYRYYFSNQDYEKKVCKLYGKLIDTDVIELFSKDYDDNEKIKRIGIAHIPNIKTSLLCNTHISDKNLSVLKCRLNNRFRKWEIEEILSNEIKVDDYNLINNLNLNIISN
jgi:hypothetical protein